MTDSPLDAAIRAGFTPFARQLHRAGLADAPKVLLEEWTTGRIDVDELARHITTVWQMAAWPVDGIGMRRWVEAWRAVGFIADTDEPAPLEALTLYRGTVWGRRRGMSWSRNVEHARWFADRNGPSGLVVVARVPPAAVLAYIGHPEGRDEDEVVVDPSMLPALGRSAVVLAS